ncbi:MarR family winged helix-turn-helix transcriptional regulator [Salipaludibacillus sp. HK11]|uniref:MarR family winged helix-turn-helix transcriptional regulator n=1 Tax=Salipaludibacillus sp. HK11 TaxID=3394320 RepID=UPI0039FD0E3C
MTRNPINTSELVKQTLSVFPLMSKKLFGPVHILHDSDLHHTHFHILHIVADVESIRTTEIAKKLAIRKSNLTPLINKLMDKEFIRRVRDEQDRRVVYIKLTEQGNNFLEEKKEILEKEVKERLVELSEEDQQKLQEAILNLDSVLSKLSE